MSPSHEPWLVALSLLVAFQGSYVGLHLARQIGRADGVRRRRLITMSALSLALAVWTMHFVGMLAVRLPVAVDFLALPTLISFLVCVLVVGFAVFAVGGGGEAGWRRIALAAAFMGGGIVTMHYLGMLALHASAHMAHDPRLVAASVAVGVAASGMALWLGFGAGARGSVTLSAALMALAIAAMHYTAMAGTTLTFHAAMPPPGAPALSPGLLAIVVSVVAFIVSGIFLLTLVPTEPAAPAARPPGPASGSDAATAAAPPGRGSAAAVAPPDASVGAPATSPAAAGTEPHADAPHAARTLPVEKDGRRRAFDVSRLVAVRAQAHYTELFDGEATWFCPLPISEVEESLDPAVFARVHRSHIVNLDRIASLRKASDAGVVTMAAPVAYQAPVSRSRRGWLKQRLDERPTAAE